MNPAVYAKALTGGGAAGSLSIIINWLVGLLAGWLGNVGAPMPADVQGAFTALIVALVTGLVVYHTANAPAEQVFTSAGTSAAPPGTVGIVVGAGGSGGPAGAQGSAQASEAAPRA